MHMIKLKVDYNLLIGLRGSHFYYYSTIIYLNDICATGIDLPLPSKKLVVLEYI